MNPQERKAYEEMLEAFEKLQKTLEETRIRWTNELNAMPSEEKVKFLNESDIESLNDFLECALELELYELCAVLKVEIDKR